MTSESEKVELELLREILKDQLNNKKSNSIEAPFKPTMKGGSKPKSTKQAEHLSKAREAKKSKAEQTKKEKEQAKMNEMIDKLYKEKDQQGGSRMKVNQDPDDKVPIYIPRSKSIEVPPKKEKVIDRYYGMFG